MSRSVLTRKSFSINNSKERETLRLRREEQLSLFQAPRGFVAIYRGFRSALKMLKNCQAVQAND